MNNFLEILKKLGGKWKSISRSKKIISIVLVSGVILASIALIAYVNRANYTVLFSSLDPQDEANIYENLQSKKIPVKLEGNTILVPKNQVDSVRMSVISQGLLSSSNQGWQIFDQSQNQFGMTDAQEQVLYQQALEGELAKTIDTFNEVDSSIVHLVLPDESVFATQSNSTASASVTVKLKGTDTLTPDQVKAIVALVSGSVKDLPKQNVQVIDTNMNVLSDGLYDDGSSTGTVAATKQQSIEQQFDNTLENNILGILGPVYGTGNLSVKVNTDLDFDSTKTSSITYDKNPVIVSTNTTKNSSVNSGTGGSSTSANQSPTNNQYSNTIGSGTNQSSTANNEQNTTNYDVGQTDQTTIKAPGEIKRMTVSVVVDGNLSQAQKQTIQNIVANATGFDASRGDSITIEGMAFNPTLKNQVQSDLKAMQQQAATAQKVQLYTTIGEYAGAGLLLLVLLLLLRKRSKKNAENLQPSLDMVVGDTFIPKQHISYEQVLEDNDDDMNIEKEIQNYAKKKPDQVIDLIKTWLTEDER